MNLKNLPRKIDSKMSSLRIRVPENLELVLEGLIRKVLREQPATDAVYSFAADYFDALVKIRDEAGVKYAASDICPFHDDEDAREMIKLADAFPKANAPEVTFSVAETNKKASRSKEIEKQVSVEEGSGEKMERARVGDSEKEGENLMSGSAEERTLGKKSTDEEAKAIICEGSEEGQVEKEEEKCGEPSGATKESTKIEVAEEAKGPGEEAQEEEEEPEEVVEGFGRWRGMAGDSRVAPGVGGGKKEEEEEEADDRNEHSPKAEKNKKREVSSEKVNEKGDKKEEEEVEMHIEKIREERETEEERVSSQRDGKKGAQEGEEKKRRCRNEEDIEGGSKRETKNENAEIVENAEFRDKVSGSQKHEAVADVKAEKQREEQKEETNAEASEVRETGKVAEVESEKKEEVAEKAEEGEGKISKKSSDGGKQSNANEEVTSEEEGKKVRTEVTRHAAGPRQHLNMPSADGKGTKSEEGAGEERGGAQTTEASGPPPDGEATEKESGGICGAADEGAKAGSEEGGAEEESGGAGDGKPEAGQEVAVERKESEPTGTRRKEDSVEDEENVRFGNQESKARKEQGFAPDEKSPRAKADNAEEKKIEEETKSRKEETEMPNKAEKEKKLEKVKSEKQKSGDEDAKEGGTASAGNEEAEEEGKQGSRVVGEEIATEPRTPEPKNDEASPTSKGNKGNAKNVETEEVERSENTEIKDDEKVESEKIIHRTPASDSKVAVKEEAAVERRGLATDSREGGRGREIVSGNAETEMREEMVIGSEATAGEPRESSTNEKNPKKEKVEEVSTESVVGVEEVAVERKKKPVEKEGKTEVEAEAETEKEGQSERETVRKRKEDKEGGEGEEICAVVDEINVVRIAEAEKLKAEPRFERQFKTIATHYYDSPQVPDGETSEWKMPRTKERGILEEAEVEVKVEGGVEAEREGEERQADCESVAPSTAGQMVIPTWCDSFDLSLVGPESATEIFLNVEKQYNSRGREGSAHETCEGRERKSRNREKAEVEEAAVKREAPAETGAVPSKGRQAGEMDEESAAAEEKTEVQAGGEKDEGASSEDSNGSAGSERTNSDAANICVEVRTLVERRVADEEEKEGKKDEGFSEVEIKVEAAIGCVPEAETAAKDEADVEEESCDKGGTCEGAERTGAEEASPNAAEETSDACSGESEPSSSAATTDTKTQHPARRNFTTTTTQSLLASQSLDSARRHPLVRTRSLSSFRQGAADAEVWTTIEKELEKAATKIQSEFRGYKARKKLRRENAVQITTEESSSNSPAEKEHHRATGEFHDSIVLSLHPR